MSMIRWEPMREMERWREAMDRFFEESFGRPSMMLTERVSSFPVDIYQTENEIQVKAAVPGIKPEDINISVLGNMLTITGERKEEKETKEENYVSKEMRMGRFQRQIMLPTEVQAENAQAKFENGIVTLTLPKSEKAKAKTIKVTTQ